MMLGLRSGAGTLQITRMVDGFELAVNSRTYPTVAGGGTYGQSIDPIGARGYDSVVPGLRSDTSYRSNAGFVNSGDTTINVGAVLLSSAGQQLGTAFVTLLPRSQTQTSLAALFPGVTGQ